MTIVFHLNAILRSRKHHQSFKRSIDDLRNINDDLCYGIRAKWLENRSHQLKIMLIVMMIYGVCFGIVLFGYIVMKLHIIQFQFIVIQIGKFIYICPYMVNGIIVLMKHYKQTRTVSRRLPETKNRA